MVSGTSFAAGEVSGLLAVMDQARAESDSRDATPALRLVRLPGGGIDACASLLRAAEPAPSRAPRRPAAARCWPPPARRRAAPHDAVLKDARD